MFVMNLERGDRKFFFTIIWISRALFKEEEEKGGVHIIFKCLYPITAMHGHKLHTYLQALPYKHFMFIWLSMSLDFIPSPFFAAVGKVSIEVHTYKDSRTE